MPTIGIDLASVDENGTPDWNAARQQGHLRFVSRSAPARVVPTFVIRSRIVARCRARPNKRRSSPSGYTSPSSTVQDERIACCRDRCWITVGTSTSSGSRFACPPASRRTSRRESGGSQGATTACVPSQSERWQPSHNVAGGTSRGFTETPSVLSSRHRARRSRTPCGRCRI